MTFRVGQKVVCVDASGLTHTKPLNRGAIYTVRYVYGEEEGGPGVLLAEIINAMHPLGEFGYQTRRFRPLVEIKTDISIFTQMLKPSKRGVDA